MMASIVLALHLFGLVTAENAYVFLYLIGAAMIIAEFFVVSLGIFAFNGLLALFVAYVLQTGDNMVLGIPVDWPFLFGISFVELGLLIAATLLFIRYRKMAVTTGTESMVGQEAIVVEWHGKKGRVRVQGENWQAVSDHELNVKADDTVKIESVKNLVLHVQA